MQHSYLKANGIQFHVVEQGAPDAPLLLLLHGFPEYWYSWRHQFTPLAEHYRVVAPDLRGYHLTDKPTTGYDLETLTSDVHALMEALGERTLTLVAHDWGGMLAWMFAYQYPECLERLVVLNCPHPVRFLEEWRANPQQLLKSWYILFFQLPWLPEILLSANDYAFIEAAFRDAHVRPGSFSDADIRLYKQAIAIPGALTAAINYYRANLEAVQLDALVRRSEHQKIACPTMLVWGTEDFALETSLTRDMERFFASPMRLELIPGCSHWIQQEAPEAVNRLLVDFLQSPLAPPS